MLSARYFCYLFIVGEIKRLELDKNRISGANRS